MSKPLWGKDSAVNGDDLMRNRASMMTENESALIKRRKGEAMKWKKRRDF
jgi:hypothetical protein